MSEQAIPTLHIWQQDCHHGDAFIFGNVEALKQLRASIDRAIATREGVDEASYFQNDGEGYSVVVRTASEAWLKLLPNGYTDFSNQASDEEREAFNAVLSGRAA